MTRQWTPYMELRPDVLAFVEHFSEEHGFPPVNLEIATRFGYSRAWASMFLDRLERDGLIVRSRETGITRKRTIRLTGTGRREARKGMEMETERVVQVVAAAAWLRDHSRDPDVAAALAMAYMSYGVKNLSELGRDHPDILLRMADGLREMIEQLPDAEIQRAESKVRKE